MEQRAQVELAAVSLAERSVVTPHLEVAQVVVVVVDGGGGGCLTLG